METERDQNSTELEAENDQTHLETTETSINEEEQQLVILYPEEAGHFYTCPVCDENYAVYTSLLRHLKRHPTKTTIRYVCRICQTEFATKKSVMAHIKKHNDCDRPEVNSQHEEEQQERSREFHPFRCEYCLTDLPSQRSLGQHIRNNHAAQASADRDKEATEKERRSKKWTAMEHQLFVDALARLGLSSNIKIAQAIGTKTAKQVGMHKRIYLRDNPLPDNTEGTLAGVMNACANTELSVSGSVPVHESLDVDACNDTNVDVVTVRSDCIETEDSDYNTSVNTCTNVSVDVETASKGCVENERVACNGCMNVCENANTVGSVPAHDSLDVDACNDTNVDVATVRSDCIETENSDYNTSVNACTNVTNSVDVETVSKGCVEIERDACNDCMNICENASTVVSNCVNHASVSNKNDSTTPDGSGRSVKRVLIEDDSTVPLINDSHVHVNVSSRNDIIIPDGSDRFVESVLTEDDPEVPLINDSHVQAPVEQIDIPSTCITEKVCSTRNHNLESMSVMMSNECTENGNVGRESTDLESMTECIRNENENVDTSSDLTVSPLPPPLNLTYDNVQAKHLNPSAPPFRPTEHTSVANTNNINASTADNNSSYVHDGSMLPLTPPPLPPPLPALHTQSANVWLNHPPPLRDTVDPPINHALCNPRERSMALASASTIVRSSGPAFDRPHGIADYPEAPMLNPDMSPSLSEAVARQINSIRQRVEGTSDDLQTSTDMDPLEELKLKRSECFNSLSVDLKEYENRHLSPADLRAFERRLSSFMEDVKRLLDPPHSPHPTTHWRRRRRNARRRQPREEVVHVPHPRRNQQSRKAQRAKRIQQLYKSKRKKAMREILDQSAPKCEIPLNTLYEYFSSNTDDASEAPPPPDWLPSGEDNGDSIDDLTVPVTAEEVQSQIRRLPLDSAPGPDGVPYSVWKRTPESSRLLTQVFNICLHNNFIPAQWKSSDTILIYKKGDLEDPKNFRPISLQVTMYKILAAVLARRLAIWAIANKKISPTQKGFLPFEGCFEQGFLLHSAIEDSKRSCKDLRILWLDLRNAFGSVPHSVMWDMMSRLSVPSTFLSFCKTIYADSGHRVVTDAGKTRFIELKQGIKQGCPLSPLLFNFVMEGFVRGIKSLERVGYRYCGGEAISDLEYADDMCLLASSKADLERMLNIVEIYAKWAGLKFNISKCGILNLKNNNGRKYVESFSPTLNGLAIPALKWEDSYRYLGVPIRRDPIKSLKVLGQKMVEDVKKICKSDLTDWQKIDAINTFVLTRANFPLRVSLVNQTWCRDIDAKVRALVKSALSLPRRTSTDFLYTSPSEGGRGLTSLDDERHLALITQCYRVLTCPDQLVREVGWSQLRECARVRTGKTDLSYHDLCMFLNTSPTTKGVAFRDVQSIWSKVRRSLALYGLKFDLDDRNDLVLVSENPAMVITHRGRRAPLSKLLNTVKNHLRLTALLKNKDQGRSFHLISASPDSSKFMRTGGGMSFSCYRFATKSRLNLLPTKTVVKRMGKTTQDTLCPQCGHGPDTLAHSFNSCIRNTGLMRERHNKILQRLKGAVGRGMGTILLDQKVPGSPGQLRPDLVCIDAEQKRVLISDVTIPFEANETSFEKARCEKERKYGELIEWCKTKYREVKFGVFVVGSLGSYDPLNEKTLDMLGVARGYRQLFRRLCALDAIQGSHAIWLSRCPPRRSAHRGAVAHPPT